MHRFLSLDRDWISSSRLDRREGLFVIIAVRLLVVVVAVVDSSSGGLVDCSLDTNVTSFDFFLPLDVLALGFFSVLSDCLWCDGSYKRKTHMCWCVRSPFEWPQYIK